MTIRLGFGMLLAALGALQWLQAPVLAADHRDAPTIDDYSAIDINDVYMFRDPANGKLVVALSTQAVADPKFGPSYHFQPDALYRFAFSTNSAAVPTALIDFVFSPFANGPSCPAPGPLCQTFTATFPNHIVVQGLTTQGTAAATPLSPMVTTTPDGSIKIFAGPREDPFFFDLVGFNRFIAHFNATKQKDFSLFTGVDAFLGKNVNAIVVEFPISLVASNATRFSVSAATYLMDSSPFDDVFGRIDIDVFKRLAEHLRQLDRMGNPAINTVLIPPPLKDAFNFGIPQNDPQDFTATIVNSLNNFGTPASTIAVLAPVAIPDTLKFDVNRPDGYVQVPPNGRLPSDATTDFLLGLILNPPPMFSPFTDGTHPKTYLTTFPFLGPPLQQVP